MFTQFNPPVFPPAPIEYQMKHPQTKKKQLKQKPMEIQ